LTCCDDDVDVALDLGHAIAVDSKALFNPVIHAHSTFALGCAEALAGLDAEAAADLTTALSIYTRFGVVREGALCQTELGYVMGRQGVAGESMRHHRGAVAKALGLRVMLEIVPAAIGLATAHLSHGDPVVGGKLVGFVDARLGALGHQLSVRDRHRLDGATEKVIARLRDGGSAERNEGATMSRVDLHALTS
jgi:hypothetical protein